MHIFAAVSLKSELKHYCTISGGKASTTTPTPTESDAEEVSPRRGRSGRVTRTSEMNGSIASDGKGDAKEVRNEPFLAHLHNSRENYCCYFDCHVDVTH